MGKRNDEEEDGEVMVGDEFDVGEKASRTKRRCEGCERILEMECRGFEAMRKTHNRIEENVSPVKRDYLMIRIRSRRSELQDTGRM